MSVYYDKILGKFRDKSVSGGGSGSQPFAFTADNYTALLAKTGMVSGDVAYVSNSQGTQWLPGTVGGNYYANGIYLYTSGSWTSDRNAISYELHLDDERLDALEASLSNLDLDDLTDVNTGLPAAPTEADDGKLLFYDNDNGLWITDDAVTHGTSVINAKKSSAGTIAKGLPVYLIGFDSDLHTVELANATSSATMPVIGFTAEVLDNTNSKHITTFGKVTGVDTSSAVSTLNPNGETWAVNDALYLSTTNGGLTKTRPTGGTVLIQRVAKILKVAASGGQFFVFNTARTAGLPNLSTDKLWLGDSNGIPQEVDKSTIVGSTSPLTIKGDLYTYDTADARLPIGTDGQSLVADSTQTTGLKWKNLPGQSTGSGTKVLVQGQMNTTQSFTSTAERIDYVDSTLDVNNEWDNTTHRFTVAASGAGVYSFTNTLFINNAGGWIQIFCKKNGVTQRITGTDLASSWDTPEGTTNIDLVVGDYVEFWADSTTNFTMDATWYSLNNFQITKIGDSVTIYNAPTDPRVTSVTSIGTLIVDSSTTDQSIITAQSGALTIAAPTGTPVHGRKLIIRLKDNGTARALTWNAIFQVIGVTLPTTTAVNKTIYVGLIYNTTDTKWDVIAIKEQA